MGADRHGGAEQRKVTPCRLHARRMGRRRSVTSAVRLGIRIGESCNLIDHLIPPCRGQILWAAERLGEPAAVKLSRRLGGNQIANIYQPSRGEAFNGAGTSAGLIQFRRRQ